MAVLIHLKPFSSRLVLFGVLGVSFLTGCTTSNGTWAVGRFYALEQNSGDLQEVHVGIVDEVKEQYQQMACPKSLDKESSPFEPKF